MACKKMASTSINKNFDEEKHTENMWSIIENYFKGKHLKQLVRHQVESYNNFVQYQIQKTIHMFNSVNIHSEQDYDESSKKYALDIQVNFDNFKLYRPQIHENNGATKLMFHTKHDLGILLMPQI